MRKKEKKKKELLGEEIVLVTTQEVRGFSSQSIPHISYYLQIVHFSIANLPFDKGIVLVA